MTQQVLMCIATTLYISVFTGHVHCTRTSISSSAQALGLPLIPPSIPEEASGQFPTGANFAVLGSTALSWDYYKTKYNFAMPAPSHLDLQLESFKKVLARIAPGDGNN